MPTCRASQLRHPLVSPGRVRDFSCRRAPFSRPVSGARLRRHASTVPPPPEKAAPDGASFRSRTKTILHKADSFLPRVLPESKELPEPLTLSFWQAALNGAYNELNAVSDKDAARIVVHGCDEYSRAGDLITALLEEPFAPPSRNEAIRERWKVADEQGIFYISHGFTQSGEANRLRVPSAWLQQFTVPAEIGELPPLALQSASGSLTRTLFSADIPIVVCNPVTIPLPTVLSNPALPLSHANAVLVITASPSASEGYADTVLKRVPSTLKVLFLDPARAVSATQKLSSSPTSSSAVQEYQNDFVGSKIAELTATVAERLSTYASRDVSDLQTTSARELTKMSLSACRGALDRASREVAKVTSEVTGLKDNVAELEARIGPEVLGADGSSVVRDAVRKAKREVQDVMDRLTWWRIVLRVDDIGDTVRTAVDRAWCRDLEDKLIFHGGQLASTQQALATSARQLVTSYKAMSTFHSPVLENHLEQLQSSPSYAVRASSLILPIHTRRAQMLPPTNMLHRTAQRVTLGMGGSVLGGLGIAWAGWAEHLGILGGALSTGMHVETALGTGALVTALGMRLMVGSWDKARKRWWRDWDRVGDGLERDLKVTLDQVVTEHVTLIPREASQGLSQIAEKRKDEIEALKEELTALEDEARAV